MAKLYTLPDSSAVDPTAVISIEVVEPSLDVPQIVISTVNSRLVIDSSLFSGNPSQVARDLTDKFNELR